MTTTTTQSSRSASSFARSTSTVQLLLIFAGRLVALAYLVVAGLAIPEVQRLASQNEYILDTEGTYRIPLLICEPGSFQINFDFTLDVNQLTQGCKSLDWILHAVTASLILSMVAVVGYIGLDLYGRSQQFSKNVNPFFLAGMGFCLLFSLLQSAVGVLALAVECNYLASSTTRNYQDAGLLDQFGIAQITTHANPVLFYLAGAMACATSVIMALESLWNLCGGPITKACTKDDVDTVEDGGDRERDPDEEDVHTSNATVNTGYPSTANATLGTELRSIDTERIVNTTRLDHLPEYQSV